MWGFPDSTLSHLSLTVREMEPSKHPTSEQPLADDLCVRAEIEQWLNGAGFVWAYGPKSVRVERGDSVFSRWIRDASVSEDRS